MVPLVLCPCPSYVDVWSSNPRLWLSCWALDNKTFWSGVLWLELCLILILRLYIFLGIFSFGTILIIPFFIMHQLESEHVQRVVWCSKSVYSRKLLKHRSSFQHPSDHDIKLILHTAQESSSSFRSVFSFKSCWYIHLLLYALVPFCNLLSLELDILPIQKILDDTPYRLQKLLILSHQHSCLLAQCHHQVGK